MNSLRENIIEILVESKRITKEKLEEALALQKEKQAPLRKILLEKGLITEEALLGLLSQQLFIPTIHLAKYRFDPDIVRLIPQQIAKYYNLIALSRMGSTLTIAMSDPLNIFALDDLRVLTGCAIDIVLSQENEISKAIEAQYCQEVKEGLPEISESLSSDADVELVKTEEIELSNVNVVEESKKPPIVKLVDLMLAQALKKRASDIHIEPEKDCLRIRYRIDGALHDIFNIPKIRQNAILARIKIISNLDITENRIPQDGRFKVKFENREVDFRVSGLPTTFGQKFVLRALDKNSLFVGLDKLGFSPKPLEVFKAAIAKPFGMILVTGPTGSGKSTTLYSVLTQLNTPARNIVTIEDPVEYQMEGITQIQVKPDIQLDFASGLRSILRHSPDVIMVGEIRDLESADIAVKASLTGQLVFSTLHTNDAISSITRLIDMGVEPFLAASGIVMLSAQRLCRRICLKCRKPVDIPADFLEKIGFTQHFWKTQKELNKTDSASPTAFKEKLIFYSAQGCKYCNYTGFYGRIAILEAVLIDDNIREMIIKRKSLEEIKKYAVESGMKTLRDDGFLKVEEEITTLDEVLRVTAQD